MLHIKTAFAIIVTYLLALTINASESGLLQLNLQEFNPQEGKVFLAIHKENKYFPSSEGAVLKKIIDLKQASNKLAIELPYGTYAIALFQDKNGNGLLDKNKLGIPKEKYALSNNLQNQFKKPSFAEASFKLDSKVKEIQISFAK